jgi:hypothetical protein
MPRSWDTKKDDQAWAAGASTPNVGALKAAVSDLPTWTVGDLLAESGGSRGLALEMLKYRGMESSKTNIISQQRSINRWRNYEEGITGKQSRKTNDAMQRVLNAIGRNKQAAQDGFMVAMSGDIQVAGGTPSRRSNRTANIFMQGDAAAAFLDNPTYAALGEAYTGDSGFAAYGDIEISIDL